MEPTERTISFETKLNAELDRIGMLEDYLSSLDDQLRMDEEKDCLLTMEDRVLQEEADTHTRRYREVVLGDGPIQLMDENNFELVLANAYVDEEQEVNWNVEAVLAKKKHKDTVYYKVKWKGRRVISWEKESDIENVAAIELFERLWRANSLAPRTSKRRPVQYITKRQLRNDPALAAKREKRVDIDLKGLWSCEVERGIWIPYCDTNQEKIEMAYKALREDVAIEINGMVYAVCFDRMLQTGGKGGRLVQRVVQVPVEVERARLEEMSLNDLRTYIQGLPDLSNVHYEAMARLHEVDKVVVAASSTDIQSLHQTTFAKLLEMIVEGNEVPCFSEECLVCLEDYVGDDRVTQLPLCGHYFHEQCAKQYFEQYSKYCPVCKTPLTSS